MRRQKLALETFVRIVCFLAFASAAGAQPVITSIQSSLREANPVPKDVQGITSGTQLSGHAFVLYINGSFPGPVSVQWLNTVTNQSQTFTEVNSSSTQLRVFVPESLYLTTVAATQTVKIIVTQ